MGIFTGNPGGPFGIAGAVAGQAAAPKKTPKDAKGLAGGLSVASQLAGKLKGWQQNLKNRPGAMANVYANKVKGLNPPMTHYNPKAGGKLTSGVPQATLFNKGVTNTPGVAGPGKMIGGGIGYGAKSPKGGM